ncbi:MAG: tRNA modification GTPase [candidate division WOR-3 bacterium]
MIRSDSKSDTICALATPPGTGSIAVIRISGPDTFAVLDRIFSGHRPSRQPSHTVRLGWLTYPAGIPARVPVTPRLPCTHALRPGSRIDQVLLTVFRKPRSYTGENMAEISCHGGMLIAETIIGLLRRLGCRLAEPGEFARRAVTAGKLTLTQAEATLDLINARSPTALARALEQYQGELSRKVQRLTSELRDLCALAEHHLGFEELASTCPRALAAGTRRLLRQLEQLIRQVRCSCLLNGGARVTIVGRPNVGKSSLFNRLLGHDRALVTSEPGTTRDRIEALTIFGDVPVTLTDTAGILGSFGTLRRKPAHTPSTGVPSEVRGNIGLPASVAGTSPLKTRLLGSSAKSDVSAAAAGYGRWTHSRAGGQRSAAGRLAAMQTHEALTQADLVIVVFDGSVRPTAADQEILAAVSDRPAIFVLNKLDKPGWREPSFLNGRPRVAVSALTGANIGRLRTAVARRLRIASSLTAAGNRHLELFNEAHVALGRSLTAANAETAALELETALACLNQIDAPQAGDGTLDRIFARFCVGK